MRTSWKSFAAVVVAAQFAFPAFAQFKTALPGYHYEFPRDFFNHADFQTEWWYYTGNLEAADGRKFGFELTFFRSGITRDPSKTSTWDVRDLYFAHFAVSDLDRKAFFYTERSNRAGPGIAGADQSQQKVWNGNWSVVWTGGEQQLAALADGFSVDLSLQSQKPPIIQGENGVSQKSSGTGRASHYFSQTRLRASGSLEVASKKYEVTGLAWMDHEFFTHCGQRILNYRPRGKPGAVRQLTRPTRLRGTFACRLLASRLRLRRSFRHRSSRAIRNFFQVTGRALSS